MMGDHARRMLILGALSLLTSSCQYMNYTYSGTYFLERSREVSPTQVEQIARDLRGALSAFGFMCNEASSYYSGDLVAVCSKSKVQHPGVVSISSLSGSNAKMSIAIGIDPASITIRDYSNTVETDFMRTLKRTIEQQLEDNGIPAARFEHQNDVFN